MSNIFKAIFKKSIASEVAHKGVWHSTVKQTFFSLRCGVRFKVVGNGLRLAVVLTFSGQEYNGAIRTKSRDNGKPLLDEGLLPPNTNTTGLQPQSIGLKR